MKKLFFAGAFALAALTSCQNSESSMSNPEDQKGTVFQSKAAARGGEELPPLSKEEEKAVIEEAIETLRMEKERGEKDETGRRPVILCHTPYSGSYGHACVYNSSGYLVNVSWQPSDDYYPFLPPKGSGPAYSAQVVNQCNC